AQGHRPKGRWPQPAACSTAGAPTPGSSTSASIVLPQPSTIFTTRSPRSSPANRCRTPKRRRSAATSPTSRDEDRRLGSRRFPHRVASGGGRRPRGEKPREDRRGRRKKKTKKIIR